MRFKQFAAISSVNKHGQISIAEKSPAHRLLKRFGQKIAIFRLRRDTSAQNFKFALKFSKNRKFQAPNFFYI